jgi:hypothetical protein
LTDLLLLDDYWQLEGENLDWFDFHNMRRSLEMYEREGVEVWAGDVVVLKRTEKEQMPDDSPTMGNWMIQMTMGNCMIQMTMGNWMIQMTMGNEMIQNDNDGE